jgi:hypothetical protein
VLGPGARVDSDVGSLLCVGICIVLAALPFAALIRVRLERRARAIARWEGEEALRHSGAEIVRTRVALDPAVEHTLWRWDRSDYYRSRTMIPPLVDEAGRPVVFETSLAAFEPGELEARVSLEEEGVFGDSMVLEKVVRVRGGSEILVRARPIDRGTELVLAPIVGGFLVRTPKGYFPTIPEPRPRPVVPLRIPVYGSLALATTLAPLALGCVLGAIDDSLAPMAIVVEMIAVIAVSAQARRIEFRIEYQLTNGEGPKWD